MLETLQEKPLKVGMKQVQRAVENGEASEVYLAEDADDFILQRLLDLCKQRNIAAIKVPTMKELGQACGIDVGAAVACIVREN